MWRYVAERAIEELAQRRRRDKYAVKPVLWPHMSQNLQCANDDCEDDCDDVTHIQVVRARNKISASLPKGQPIDKIDDEEE